MTTGADRGKMAWALHCMSVSNKYQTRYENSRLVAHARKIAPKRNGWVPTKDYIERRTGKNHWFYGKKRPEHSVAMSGKNSVNWGKPISEYRRQSVISSNKMRRGLPKAKHEVITCDICGKTGGSSNMKRYHFDNCKDKQYV
jgi:hypothetical protein